MANMHLVTGYAGEAHVTAADQASMYAAVFGNGSYVLNRGNKLSATVITNNQIRVHDGDLLLQGRHVRLNGYIDLAIENGAQGYNRNDLIVARYSRNASTGIEECNLVVIKGTATTGTAKDPAHITGDLLGGNADNADMLLYRVPISGLSVGTLKPLFATAAGIPVISYGTASPSGGSNGDIYFQITT